MDPNTAGNPLLTEMLRLWETELNKKYDPTYTSNSKDTRGREKTRELAKYYARKEGLQGISDAYFSVANPAFAAANFAGNYIADKLGYQQGGMVNTSQMDPNTLTKFVYGGNELPISPIVAYDNNDIQSKNVDDPFLYRMGGLYKYDGINNSQVAANDYDAWLKQKAEQEAAAEYNDYMNRTKTDASTFMKYEANPNDAVYQQILQRKLGTIPQAASTQTGTQTTRTQNYNYGYGAGYPMTGGYGYPTAPTIGQQIKNIFSPFKYNPATGGNYDFNWMSQQGPARTASGAIFQPQGQLQGMIPVAGTNADGTAQQSQPGYMYDYKFEKGPWWSGKKTMTISGKWVDPNNPNAGTTAGGASANTTADNTTAGNIAEGYNPKAAGPGYSGFNADSDGNGIPDYLQTPNPRETQTGTSTSTNTVAEEMSPRERRQQRRVKRMFGEDEAKTYLGSNTGSTTLPAQSTTSTPATGVSEQPLVNQQQTTSTSEDVSAGSTIPRKPLVADPATYKQINPDGGFVYKAGNVQFHSEDDLTPEQVVERLQSYGYGDNNLPKQMYGGASNYMEFGGYVPEFNPGGQFSGAGPFNPNSSNLGANPNQAITGPCTEFEVQNPNSPCYDPNYKPSALQSTTPEDFSVTYDINKARTLDTNKVANAGQYLGAGVRGISAGLNDTYNTDYLASRSTSDNREPVNQLDYRGGYSGLNQRIMSKGQGAGSTGFNYVVGEAAFVKKGGELKFRQGGVYDLTQEEIGQILAAGGQIKFI